MKTTVAPRALPAAAKRALRILLIAKHVHWEDGLHPSDGSHALYHREMRQALERIGVDLMLADSYQALFTPTDADFVFPLLNRGGFLNSEMMLPLLCERLNIPYLGASPILRGLSDDKHLCKRIALQRGLPTAPWAVFRRGGPIDLSICPSARRYVVKPNASSASWGIGMAHDRDEIRAQVIALHAQGHDAIVEPFIPGHDIEVSVVTIDGEPFILPTQIVEQDDPSYLRTYAEKRNLVGGQAYMIRPLHDARLIGDAERMSREMMREFQPFDYGRFEYRLDEATGELRFMEVNLNCNLWSKKTIAMAASQIGWNHDQLIETILTESLRRHGLLAGSYELAA
ncbi:D-alanine--D-alanine ligase family protein [Sphingomonas crocodyli]|uniref:Phosphoribosylglycinamide synthetase n=1 Tax=Sphingomonas crocodyli TaxID=1979270 RepID=A0A437LWF2_9SPHN|nr:phosphoribosylglycinamide synthetase [Sphingomonas crocodyli]RVT89735.1 phosphoribosylglycinamide synthetase [Sphingomonas crocodyli]